MTKHPALGSHGAAAGHGGTALRLLRSPAQAAQWLRARSRGTLCADSRNLLPGDAFLAWPGAVSDARAHVRSALSAGALACLVESEGVAAFGFGAAADADVDAFAFTDAAANAYVTRIACYAGLKQAAGPIASAYFDQPSAKLELLAVTGTNGKTSTAWWLAQALSAARASGAVDGAPTVGAGPCAVIGTLGIGLPPQLTPSGLTTPDPVLLNKSLREMVDVGCSACAIEASSVGLSERRLDGLHIKLAIFTNFTQDHLDYHGSMDAYWQAKAELFRWPGLAAAVVNIDDPKGAALAAELEHSGVALWTYSTQKPARLRAQDVNHAAHGLSFCVCEGAEQHVLHSALAGQFNVSNLLAVLASMRALGLSLARAVQACRQLQAVPGRMQRVVADEDEDNAQSSGQTRGAAAQPIAVVDYAHTPDALEKALAALRPLATERAGRLWCVFGCGGNRDAGKRPLMAAAAAAGADRVVVTSDNPRSESAQDIINQILKGFSPMQAGAITVQSDRALAILQTLMQAAKADVVLLAGKGHEEYQETNGQRLPFSDRAHAAAALRKRSLGATR